MPSGIYCILNTSNGRRYVGQSVNLSERKWSHFTDLRHGRHHNQHLQAAWNKYGPACFQWSILEVITDPSVMDAQERHWIALHQANDPNHGYNAEPGGLTRPKASCVTRQRMQRSQWIRHNQDKLDERERFWIEHHKSNQHKHGYNMESGGRTNAAPHGETIEKIKAALKKSRPNDDWKAHLSAMNKGKRFISEERKQMLDLQKIETQKRLDAQKEKRMINFNGKVFLSATQRIFPQWGAHLGEKFDKRVRRKMCKSQMKSYLKNPRAIDDKGRFVSH